MIVSSLALLFPFYTAMARGSAARLPDRVG